jgi:hypothetical protein
MICNKYSRFIIAATEEKCYVLGHSPRSSFPAGKSLQPRNSQEVVRSMIMSRLQRVSLLLLLSTLAARGQSPPSADVPPASPVLAAFIPPPPETASPISVPEPQAIPLAIPQPPPSQSAQDWTQERQCPGGFPSDLTRLNCLYPQRQRTIDWVTSSLTDEAMLNSAGAALGAFMFADSPTTWPRTGLGYLRDWRASYLSGMANGTTQYLLNSAFNLNPEHVSCRTGWFIRHESLPTLGPDDPDNPADQSNPLQEALDHDCTVPWRIFHVILDTVATRKSTPMGRAILSWPSPRLVGAFAGAFAESPWEPQADNSTQEIFTRAGESLIVPAIGALFNEFPSLLQTLTKPLHKKTPLPVWPPQGAK